MGNFLDNQKKQTVMVSKSEYGIGRATARKRRRLKTFVVAMGIRVSPIVKVRLFQRYRHASRDVHKINLRKNHISSAMFDIRTYSDHLSLHDFRFRVTDITKISPLLHLPNGKTRRRGYVCNDITSCCIVLKRLSSPCNWMDLEVVFGIPSPALSEIFWETVEAFIKNYGHLVTDFKSEFMRERAPMYAERVRAKGAPLERCVGFMDCTKIRMERPGGINSLQRACYSGHKRMPCLVYQTVTTPDGLIFSLYGPVVGRRHDLTVLRESGLNEELQNCLNINGDQFYIFGDKAYVLRPWLQVGFDSVNATAEQQIFNTEMSRVREAVEWSYKDLKQMWTRNDFARSLKVRQAPISLLFIASTVLLNFKTCLENGGQVGAYFECSGPTLSRYLLS